MRAHIDHPEPEATRPPGPSHGDWRRLGYAAAFFAACLSGTGLLFAIGFYH